MKLQQLKYLLAIVDNGLNITSAAERLYTSQPGVSKQLKLLEEELGVALFSRRGKSLAEITPAGEAVIERARTIMQEVENIRSLASNIHGEQEGTLSIGTTHTQARYVLPDVIRQFRKRYPKVALNLHQGTSEQIADMVQANAIDFAIATGARDLFQELTLLPCYHWDRIVLVPSDHELAGLDGKLSLEVLAKQPLVTYVFSFTGESSLKKAFAAEGLKPNVVFTARDADVIKTYVRMGLGVGLVAAMAHECADNESLVAIDATGLFPRSTTWIGFRRDAVLRQYMADFIELFAPHLTSELLHTAADAPTQAEVDALFRDVALPVRAGCGDSVPSAA
ncbi:MAG: HTH-type transcriptional regulator CysB [Pseudomonadota bacterium]